MSLPEGALYIMFEDHVRSWPPLKTPFYTRGYMSKNLCVQIYSIVIYILLKHMSCFRKPAAKLTSYLLATHRRDFSIR